MATETKIINIEVPLSDKIAAVVKLKEEISNLKEQQKENKLSTDAEKQAYEANAIAVKEYQRQIRQLTTEVGNEVKASQEQLGAYNKLQNEYAIASQKAKDLGAQYGVQSKEATTAAAAAKKMGDELKAIDASIGQHQRNVGDYAIAVKKLPGIFGEMQEKGQSIFVTLRDKWRGMEQVTMSAISAIEAQKLAQLEASAAQMAALEAEAIAATAAAEAEAARAAANTVAATTGETSAAATTQLAAAEAAEATASTAAAEAEAARATATNAATVASEAGAAAMKILKYAIASTGIGLLVVALGSVVTYFSQTNDGAKVFQKIMSGVNAVIQSYVKIMGNYGRLIYDLFTGNFKALGGDIETLKNSMKDAAGDIVKNYKAGEKAAKDRQALTKQERDWMSERTRLEGDYAVLVQNAGKRNALSDEVRLKAAKDAIAIKEKIYQQDLKIAKETLRVVELEQAAKSKKDMQAIADAKNKVEQVIATHKAEYNSVNNLMGKTEARMEASGETQAQKAKTLAEKMKAIQSDGISATIKLNEMKKNRTEKDFEDVYQLELKYNALKAKSEKELEMLNAQSLEKRNQGIVDYQQKQAEQAINHAKAMADIQNLQDRQRLAGVEQTNQQIFESTEKRIKAEKELALKSLDKSKMTAQEYNDAVALINQEALTKSAENKAAFNAAQAENEKTRKAEDLANELATLNEHSTRALEIKKAQLDAQMAEETKAAEKTGADKSKIEKKYSDAKKKLDKIEVTERLNQAQTITNGLAQLFGKHTKAGKAAAAASTAIETYKGAQAALASTAGAGPVGWVLGAVQAGVIVASGVKAISDIYAVKEDSAPSVSGAGGGAASPAVSPDTVSKMYTPLKAGVTEVQAAGGANTIVSGAATAQPLINYDAMAGAMKKAVSELPPQQLAITELREKEKQVDFMDNISSFSAK